MLIHFVPIIFISIDWNKKETWYQMKGVNSATFYSMFSHFSILYIKRLRWIAFPDKCYHILNKNILKHYGNGNGF